MVFGLAIKDITHVLTLNGNY